MELPLQLCGTKEARWPLRWTTLVRGDGSCRRWIVKRIDCTVTCESVINPLVYLVAANRARHW
ncbi:hypothetical protein BKA81DRAFT_351938 [Phyllosticta paracitricarpa]